MASIVEGLAARGHELDVLLPFHPEFRYPDGERLHFAPYRYSPIKRLSPWGFGGSLKASSRVTAQTAIVLPGVVVSLRRQISHMLGSHHYDVVHANWLVPNAWLAQGPATKRGVATVVSLHGSDMAVAERPALRRLAGRTLSQAGVVTACSDDLRERAVSLGAEPSMTRTVHYGVDTSAFAPRSVSVDDRDRLGAHPGELLVVAVGRLVEKKGFSYLIDAVSRINGVRLAIVGDGDLRLDLEARARAVNAAVTFTGNLNQSWVSVALSSADVVAVPSVVDRSGNVDGLPNSLLEALSAGQAVVASDIAGIPEVIEDRKNGLLVPPEDADALARSIMELRDKPDLRRRLGAEARRTAVSELDWTATAEAFEGAYRDSRVRLGAVNGE
jgi:glycosyltransferase involved in cell wall biosynthesis